MPRGDLHQANDTGNSQFARYCDGTAWLAKRFRQATTQIDLPSFLRDLLGKAAGYSKHARHECHFQLVKFAFTELVLHRLAGRLAGHTWQVDYAIGIHTRNWTSGYYAYNARITSTPVRISWLI